MGLKRIQALLLKALHPSNFPTLAHLSSAFAFLCREFPYTIKKDKVGDQEGGSEGLIRPMERFMLAKSTVR